VRSEHDEQEWSMVAGVGVYSAPLHPTALLQLHLCTSAPLHLHTSATPQLRNSAPLHLCTFAPTPLHVCSYFEHEKSPAQSPLLNLSKSEHQDLNLCTSDLCSTSAPMHCCASLTSAHLCNSTILLHLCTTSVPALHLCTTHYTCSR
jgi:hypothetical protein